MSVDRRSLLKGAAAAAAGIVVAGCDGGEDASKATPPSHPAGAAAPTPASPAPSSEVTAAKPAPPALPDEVGKASGARPEVALTFHGQGTPDQVERLLGLVERAHGQVTVLAVGGWLAQYPTLAGRVLAGGHELGNHSENHLDMPAMDAATAYREIAQCAERLKALTGSQGRWFRPSQTQYANAVIKAQAAKAGYPTCLSYSLDSLDHTDPGAAAVTRNVLDRVRAGDVVSMHCGHEGTIAALPAVLDGLRAKGLTPVTASALFA
ncbi:polysaccharide deacetylase family protein [Yinghuangia seranimata]|uniref:polysaccharide deacetylase family protein n=1 Tax=Yinghuangia seranimata TaxID=408067 RepID=UPI00248ABF01|nr:polysaccharide deacetylase family protein [Yinghuangia seranimata]MDI2127226.1 polysaccharide deacetylase family protein [Yinghuangia seranimata]